MKILRFALIVLFAIALPGQSPAPEAPIIQIVADYNAARDSQDPKAIERLFVDDADQLVSNVVWRHGKDTLVQGMLASSAGNPGDRTLTVETVRFVTSDVALADARYEIAGAQGVRKMWSTFLVVKTANGWRIAAIRNMLPAQ
ncbi:MAG: nuclear transport factor 2 family protein [Acidobacteria bacterium]|nr:nuclear transport factor 2 family protein [Acidobacteriota bacterium]MDA1233484.1 nuclear transport factor 2 family protein [Acidobacteriota bacterium]